MYRFMEIPSYTTSIDTLKTIAEIEGYLISCGATDITKRIEDKQCVEISFFILLQGKPYMFQLPCKYEGIFRKLQGSPKLPKKLQTREQALRVSWRIVLMWVKAQLAMIDSELMTLPQLFLSNMSNESGKTFFEILSQNPKLLK